jgi:hypothetical protein
MISEWGARELMKDAKDPRTGGGYTLGFEEANERMVKQISKWLKTHPNASIEEIARNHGYSVHLEYPELRAKFETMVNKAKAM